MAIIPNTGDPLIAGIDRVLLNKEALEPVREYVGASSIGDDCSRALWYGLQGRRGNFQPDALRRFEDGHRTEAAIVDWIKQIPSIELHAATPDGKQYGFSDLNGKYKGHYDGVIRGLPQAPETWHIFEVKCTDEKYFKELQKIIELVGEKAALQKWRPVYYAQAVTYMWYEKLTRHTTVVSTPGARDLLTLRTEQNHTYAKALRDKAKRIINATEPPERIGGADFYKCKMCSHYGECHG